MKNGDRYYRMKHADSIRTGEIYIDGVIQSDYASTDVFSKEFNNELKQLGNISRLNIHINSPGGEVFEGQAIYSILRRHSARKIVHIDGLAASIASVIAMAGDEVIMSENAYMMIHDPWTMIIGNAREIRKMADDLDKINGSIVNAYKNKITDRIDEDYIRMLMKAESWLDADEAIRLGFANTKKCDSINDIVIDKQYKALYKNIPECLLKERKESIVSIDRARAYKELLLLK